MLRNLLGLPLAYLRRAYCRFAGHRFDKQIPAPDGLVTCSRCHERYPLVEGMS
jgi:hypothetical protein